MRSVILAALLLPLACGDSTGPDADIPQQLVGQWIAEQACAPPCAFTLTWTENAAAQLDAVAVFNLRVRVGITAAGRFTRSGSGDPAEGRVALVDGALVVTDARNVVDTIDYRVEGEYLHLAFRREFVEVDFDGDLQLDPARLTGVFRREP